jgi:peroxiredoxin/mono/diheme cytochrome c family protein
MHRTLLYGALVAVPLAALAAPATEPPATATGTARSARTIRSIDPAKIDLIDVATGRTSTLRALAGAKATLVFFTSNECPVAVAYEQELAARTAGLVERGVAVVAVSATASDTRDAIRRHRDTARLPYAIYRDAGSRLAAALDATRTSEVALVAPDGQVLYQGRIDDRISPTIRRARATTHELGDAIDAVLADRAVAVARTQAAGCAISRARPVDAAARVSYARDVAPILERYCAGCHRPGEAGPMALLTYEDASSWGETIAEVLRDRRMPPARQSPPDPRWGTFVEEPGPSAAEIATITAWVNAGAPGPGTRRAASAYASASADPPWAIGKPDLVLTMPRPYAVPATGVVEYQHTELLQYTGEERWVEAIEIRPSARTVVHHADIFMASPELGTVSLGPGERWAAFAPGRPATAFPAGVARRLPTGAKLTLELHYTPDGVARDDRTTVAIRFARARPKYETRSIPLGSLNFEIPAGAAAHEVTSSYTLKADGRIASFTPHMHDRGKDFRYEATLPDGTTRTLLFVPRYNFNWQFVYVPTEMIALPRGTVLRGIAHFDNSPGNPTNPDPAAAVRWGQQTFEEMMFGFVELIYDEDIGSPALKALREADKKTLPQDLGFASWNELIAWGQAMRARRAAR